MRYAILFGLAIGVSAAPVAAHAGGVFDLLNALTNASGAMSSREEAPSSGSYVANPLLAQNSPYYAPNQYGGQGQNPYQPQPPVDQYSQPYGQPIRPLYRQTPYGGGYPLAPRNEAPGFNGQRAYHEDQAMARQAQQQAAVDPRGSSYEWSNPQTGNHGEAHAVSQLLRGEEPGTACRLVEEHVYINGRQHANRGLVCLPEQEFNFRN